MPCKSAWQPGAVPGVEVFTRLQLPDAHARLAEQLHFRASPRRGGIGGNALVPTGAAWQDLRDGHRGALARGRGRGQRLRLRAGRLGNNLVLLELFAASPWSVAASTGTEPCSRTTCSAGACGCARSGSGSSSPWISWSRGLAFCAAAVEGVVRACSSTMIRRSPMEIRLLVPQRRGEDQLQLQVHRRGSGRAEHVPSAPLSITAWVGATVADSSNRSVAALPRRMRSARKARAHLSFPPSYTLRTMESWEQGLGRALRARPRARGPRTIGAPGAGWAP